jgi:NAD-dependent dihydropyrimidine dehydrogenase PreA subunit
MGGGGMIEIISEVRCIECDICVKVCPANVFDRVPEAAPVIARQNDCQTCFLCEIYCPTDALYVAPTPRDRPRSARRKSRRKGCSAATRAD